MGRDSYFFVPCIVRLRDSGIECSFSTRGCLKMDPPPVSIFGIRSGPKTRAFPGPRETVELVPRPTTAMAMTSLLQIRTEASLLISSCADLVRYQGSTRTAAIPTGRRSIFAWPVLACLLALLYDISLPFKSFTLSLS